MDQSNNQVTKSETKNQQIKKCKQKSKTKTNKTTKKEKKQTKIRYIHQQKNAKPKTKAKIKNKIETKQNERKKERTNKNQQKATTKNSPVNDRIEETTTYCTGEGTHCACPQQNSNKEPSHVQANKTNLLHPVRGSKPFNKPPLISQKNKMNKGAGEQSCTSKSKQEKTS